MLPKRTVGVLAGMSFLECLRLPQVCRDGPNEADTHINLPS